MCANSPADIRKSSFPPVAADNTRLLVLGSLPGESSLAARRYYAHPRNLFWHLMGPVIGVNLASLGYEERLAALLQAKVGLWDTVASAVRPGSLDVAIREEEHTPLADFVATLPDLRAVAFNGAKSAKIGMRLLAGSGVELIALPSSSPAHAAMRLADKERLWLALRKFLA